MGPHDDDGSGVTLAVALRAVPVYPATAAITATATPSANSETFLLNAPSSIVRPDVSVPREEPFPACLASAEYFALVTGFQGGSVMLSALQCGCTRGGGAIGRRDGLKSHCPSGRVGSSPT